MPCKEMIRPFSVTRHSDGPENSDSTIVSTCGAFSLSPLVFWHAPLPAKTLTSIQYGENNNWKRMQRVYVGALYISGPAT